MIKTVVSLLLTFACYLTMAQSFEVSGFQDGNIKGVIGETIRVPLRLRNPSDKPIILIVKRLSTQIGSTQKNYFCIDAACLDSKVEEYQVKIEPSQSFGSLNIVLEGGLTQTISQARYVVYNRSNPSDAQEFDLNFTIDERTEKPNIYASTRVTLRDVYPNPVIDHAFVDYQILNDQVKAKIVLHNILGNPIEEYDLPPSENKVKIRADGLSAGIYFYTLYLDNEGVMTRKLIIKK